MFRQFFWRKDIAQCFLNKRSCHFSFYWSGYYISSRFLEHTYMCCPSIGSYKGLFHPAFCQKRIKLVFSGRKHGISRVDLESRLDIEWATFLKAYVFERRSAMTRYFIGNPWIWFSKKISALKIVKIWCCSRMCLVIFAFYASASVAFFLEDLLSLGWLHLGGLVKLETVFG